MTHKKDIDGYADGGGESADAASAANTADAANVVNIADADAADESTLGLTAAPFGK